MSMKKLLVYANSSVKEANDEIYKVLRISWKRKIFLSRS